MSNLKVDSIKGHDPTFTIDMPTDANLNVNGTMSVTGFESQLAIPKGTTAQRPSSPSAGMIRFNTSVNAMELYNGSTWSEYGASTGGAGTSGPYKTVNATSVEAFWDGAADQISGSTWLSKISHPSVSNANCTMINSPSYTSSVPGGDGSIGYWSFNGSNQYGWINDLRYGSGAPHGPQNNGRLYEFVCLAWFRTTYGSPNSGGAWDSDNWSWYDWDRSESISWNIGNHGKIQFSGESNVTCCYDITGNTPANDGNWHFAAVVVSAANSYMRFYLDGNPDGQHNHSFSYFGAGTQRWGFIGDGSEAGGNNGSRNEIYYEGDIAQLGLISEFWSDAQVLDHYTKTRTRFGV